MITCDASGKIKVEVNGSCYCLDDADQYSEFLLWATSPDPAVTIAAEVFTIDPGVSEEHRERAQRYAASLSCFAAKRMERLSAKEPVAAYEELKRKIDELIKSFKQD